MKNIFKIVALAACLLSSPALAQFSQDAVVGTSAAASSNLAPTVGYVSTWWYMPDGPRTSQSGQAASINTIVCRYSSVGEIVTITSLGMYITAVGTTNVQLAIYSNVSGRPGSLIGRTNNIVNTSTGTVSGALAANKQVGPSGADGGSDLWFCFNSGDSTVTGLAEASSGLSQLSGMGSPTLANLSQATGSQQTGVSCAGAACNGGSSTFNTWPASLAGSTWTSNQGNSTGNQMPLVFFQAQ